MQFGLRNPNNTSTNFKHVCSMDSHFKDNINLPNPHSCVSMILFDMNRPFFWLLLKAKFKIAEIRIAKEDTLLQRKTPVRILKSGLLKGIFGKITGRASKA